MKTTENVIKGRNLVVALALPVAGLAQWNTLAERRGKSSLVMLLGLDTFLDAVIVQGCRQSRMLVQSRRPLRSSQHQPESHHLHPSCAWHTAWHSVAC